MGAVIALGAVLLVWGAVSGRLVRFRVTPAIALAAAGALFTAGADPVLAVPLSGEAVQVLLELTLAILLFCDATEVSARWLRRSARVPLRLLAISFPLTVGAGFLVGSLLLPTDDVWIVALLAAALAATDAALASPVILDRRVPAELRRVIDVESGLNDGLATPVVLFFLASAVITDEDPGATPPLLGAALELALGVGVGVVLGVVGGRLLAGANRRGWDSPSGTRIAVLALAVLAYATAVAAGGNGFVAAFVGGIAAGSTGREVVVRSLPLSSDVGAVLAAAVWFVFGTVVPAVLASGLTWAVVGYAVLSLTVVRMLPVAISLLGSGTARGDVLFIGWIGPRGMASILFGLIALEELRPHDASAAALVAQVIVVTVALSVVAHGVSAGFLAARWPGPSSEGTARAATPA